MNVSSVKNLNGEAFSAVQDATLTDVVQTNSATWNEISAYELASGNYLTAVPTGYATTAQLESTSSFLSGAIDYVSANAGSTLTGDAQGAVDNVYSNSSRYVLNNANGVYIGNDNTANTNGFAQGGSNKAEGYSIAQGLYNKANGYSVAQGQFCTASNESIAQGAGNSADNYSQAFGGHTKANNSGMAIGTYNNITTAAFVIGNGNSNARNDCFIIDHNGNVSACGKISANGVELGAGGGGNPEVESYVQTNSANIDDTVTSYQTNSGTFLTAHQAISAEEWNDCYDNVNTNSGAWGGSALPISAGPGVKLQLVNNTLVVSNDETVLYNDLTGRPTATGTSIVLNSSPLNFEYVEVYLNGTNSTGMVGLANSYQKIDTRVLASSTLLTFNGILSGNSSWWDTGCAYKDVSSTTWTKIMGYTKQIDSSAAGMMNNVNHLNIYKVVGVNRIVGE